MSLTTTNVGTKPSALSRISAALKKSRKVKNEIAEDGVWFLEIEKPGYLTFQIEYDGRTMTAGWYNIVNGDYWRELEFKFRISRTVAPIPVEYRSDPRTNFFLEEEFCAAYDWGMNRLEAGSIAAEKYGVYKLLEDFDQTVERVYENEIIKAVQ
jgi:hypothetical protein